MLSNLKLQNKVFLILFFIITMALITGCAEKSKVNEPAKSESKKNNEANPKSSESDLNSGEISQEVLIEGLSFKAATTTVKPGTTIIWKNLDAEDHEIHANDGAWHSEPVGKDETFEVKVDTAGKYGYHCHIHPGMNGTIIVE